MSIESGEKYMSYKNNTIITDGSESFVMFRGPNQSPVKVMFPQLVTYLNTALSDTYVDLAGSGFDIANRTLAINLNDGTGQDYYISAIVDNNDPTTYLEAIGINSINGVVDGERRLQLTDVNINLNHDTNTTSSKLDIVPASLKGTCGDATSITTCELIPTRGRINSSDTDINSTFDITTIHIQNSVQDLNNNNFVTVETTDEKFEVLVVDDIKISNLSMFNHTVSTYVGDSTTTSNSGLRIQENAVSLATSPLGVTDNELFLEGGVGVTLKINGSTGNNGDVLGKESGVMAWLGQRYSNSFIIGDWGVGTTLTYTATTHGLGTGYHSVTVFDSSNNVVPIGAVLTNININPTTGDVVITIVNNAAAFAGSIYITK